MRQVAVFMNDIKAGILTEEHPGKGYTFCYDTQYLSSDEPAISVTLPKKAQKYESEFLFPFFTNMLPEGSNRKVICRLNRIDEYDFFGLLIVMADKDFIGAVNIKSLDHDENR